MAIYQKCKNCGASASVNKQKNMIICSFCGTEYNFLPPNIFEKKQQAIQKKKQKVKIIVAAAIGLVFLFIFFLYNSIINDNENTKEQWTNVLIQYERRAKLIPEIERTVNQYMKYEKSIFMSITKRQATIKTIRITKINGDDSKAKVYLKEQQQLTKEIRKVMLRAVRYPNLKADRLFINLQTNIEGSLNRIAVAQRRFSMAVSEYNKTISRFPANMIAGLFDYTQKQNYIENK